MAFQLKANESVRDGIARNVRREIDKALGSLDAKVKPRERAARDREAVHEVRKCFKKVRAALRLVREDLGNDGYHEENWCFRDAARPLTEVRDAQMLVEIVDKLTRQIGGQIGAATLAKVHDALRANEQAVTQRVLADDRAFTTVGAMTRAALARLSAWQIDRDGWEAVEGGLRRVYRAGHRALRLALRLAAENPSVENLHEWRKQAKYLWHALQLLEPAWTGREKDLGDRAHTLTQLLGEDHDLAVLRQTLAADPSTYGGHAPLKALFVLVDRRRQELERQAFALGQELYADQPRVFSSRIAEYWKAWTQRPRHCGAPSSPSSTTRSSSTLTGFVR